jgi:hypothetical protein
MIGMINSLVGKVVDTVSGPLHSWGPKAVKKAMKASKCRKKCKNKRCKCS